MEKEIDKTCYDLAYQYLLSFKDYGVTSQLINQYLHQSENQGQRTFGEIYLGLLKSATNSGMKPGVIKGAIGSIENLNHVLFDFNPHKVAQKYEDNWKKVSDDIKDAHLMKIKVRMTHRGIWPMFCKSIVSSASFLSQFKDAKEFYVWVNFFDKDDRSRVALPFLISQEVHGIGFALACDFLKELGYINFGKPDVHIIKIFKGLGLCGLKDNEYQVFKAIVRVAKNNGVSPYNADKLFWLVGSGFFYDDKNHLGKPLRITTNKDDFIKSTRKRLEEKFHIKI